MHVKEIETVQALPASERYSYWVKRVADREEVWSLWADGGWAMAADDAGATLLPFWPATEFAKNCAAGVWENYEPRSIDLTAFRERWIPGIKKDGRMLAIFPTPADRGITIAPDRVDADLSKELTQYE